MQRLKKAAPRIHLNGTPAGTGIFLASDRVLTCWHVILGAEPQDIEVRFFDSPSESSVVTAIKRLPELKDDPQLVPDRDDIAVLFLQSPIQDAEIIAWQTADLCQRDSITYGGYRNNDPKDGFRVINSHLSFYNTRRGIWEITDSEASGFSGSPVVRLCKDTWLLVGMNVSRTFVRDGEAVISRFGCLPYQRLKQIADELGVTLPTQSANAEEDDIPQEEGNLLVEIHTALASCEAVSDEKLRHVAKTYLNLGAHLIDLNLRDSDGQRRFLRNMARAISRCDRKTHENVLGVLRPEIPKERRERLIHSLAALRVHRERAQHLRHNVEEILNCVSGLKARHSSVVDYHAYRAKGVPDIWSIVRIANMTAGDSLGQDLVDEALRAVGEALNIGPADQRMFSELAQIGYKIVLVVANGETVTEFALEALRDRLPTVHVLLLFSDPDFDDQDISTQVQQLLPALEKEEEEHLLWFYRYQHAFCQR